LSILENSKERRNANYIYNESVKMVLGKEKSFYKEVNGSWLVIKFSCDEPIIIKELCVAFHSNLTAARKADNFYILFDKNHVIYYAGGNRISFCWNSDLFVHLNLFFINFTYYRLNKGNFSSNGIGWGYNITLPPNTYYLVCLGTKSKETNIKVWINVTGNVDFLATAQGNTSYLLDATDFLGRVNVYWNNGSIIRGCKKTFFINNTLLGYLSIEGGIGITNLKLINPKGVAMRGIVLDLGFKKYNYGWGKRRYIIGNENICGYIIDSTKGNWTIKINMLEITGIRVKAMPDIIFHYGDIILP